MATDEIETVLANWIEQALSPIGRLPEGVAPGAWAAARFSAWWRDRAGGSIGDAERSAAAVRQELMPAQLSVRRSAAQPMDYTPISLIFKSTLGTPYVSLR
jgi:hypothetical protein